MTIESGWMLASGDSLYADRFKQDTEGHLEPESGQVPNLNFGIKSAYPSPDDYASGLLPLDSGKFITNDETVDSFLNFVNNQLSTKAPQIDNPVLYLANYIHYYPKVEEVSTGYSTEIVYNPVFITPLNFTPIAPITNEFYEHVEESEETEEE